MDEFISEYKRVFNNSKLYFEKNPQIADQRYWIEKAQSQINEIDELYLNFREPEKYKLSNSTLKAVAAASSVVRSNILLSSPSHNSFINNNSSLSSSAHKRSIPPRFDEYNNNNNNENISHINKKRKSILNIYRDSQLPHDECDKILEIITTSTSKVSVYSTFKTPIKILKSYIQYTNYVKRPISFPNITVYIYYFIFFFLFSFSSLLFHSLSLVMFLSFFYFFIFFTILFFFFVFFCFLSLSSFIYIFYI